MNRRKLLASGAVLGAAMISRHARADVVKFRLGTVDPPTSHSGVGADAFAKEVATRSNGTMQVDVFHAGSLGSIPDQMKNVFTGVAGHAPALPRVPVRIRRRGQADLRAIPVPRLQAPRHLLQERRLQAGGRQDQRARRGAARSRLDLGDHDPRGLVSVRPVMTPADLTGMKVRLWEDKTAIETWRGLGGNPIVIPRPQVYLALKQGLIEAGPETIGIAYDTKDDRGGEILDPHRRVFPDHQHHDE